MAALRRQILPGVDSNGMGAEMAGQRAGDMPLPDSPRSAWAQETLVLHHSKTVDEVERQIGVRGTKVLGFSQRRGHEHFAGKALAGAAQTQGRARERATHEIPRRRAADPAGVQRKKCFGVGVQCQADLVAPGAPALGE